MRQSLFQKNEILKFLEIQRYHVYNMTVSRRECGNILTFEVLVKSVQEFFVLFMHLCKSKTIFFKLTKRMLFFSHFASSQTLQESYI